MAFLPLLCLEWLGISNSTGIFDFSDTETPVLLEAESKISQPNSTNLAQVLQPTVNHYSFMCLFSIYFIAVSDWGSERSKISSDPQPKRIANDPTLPVQERSAQSSPYHKYHTLRKHVNTSADKNQQKYVQGNSNELKYFLLWTSPVPSNISPNHRCVLSASFIPAYHRGEASSRVQGSSHTCCAANQKKWPSREQRKSLGKDWADKALQNP